MRNMPGLEKKVLFVNAIRNQLYIDTGIGEFELCKDEDGSLHMFNDILRYWMGDWEIEEE